uniref:Uncharacterized protein n=1 Tax=Fagus sylvatica TaxID=28930 RepID=A0A2N9F9P8_FAGSY
MCGNPNIEVPIRPKISELTLESRLIHHIITHNILLRSGSYEYISYIDAFIIWCILNKVKLDLAFDVGWHMDACVKKKNGALPYGLHITTILNHFGVNYEFKDNTWVKKDAHVVEEMDEEAQMKLLKEMKKQCKRIKSLQPHLLAPLVSMRTTSNSCLDVWTLWPLA